MKSDFGTWPKIVIAFNRASKNAGKNSKNRKKVRLHWRCVSVLAWTIYFPPPPTLAHSLAVCRILFYLIIYDFCMCGVLCVCKSCSIAKRIEGLGIHGFIGKFMINALCVSMCVLCPNIGKNKKCKHKFSKERERARFVCIGTRQVIYDKTHIAMPFFHKQNYSVLNVQTILRDIETHTLIYWFLLCV